MPGGINSRGPNDQGTNPRKKNCLEGTISLSPETIRFAKCSNCLQLVLQFGLIVNIMRHSHNTC